MPEDTLEARILDFVRGATKDAFEDLALKLFERQFEEFQDYRRHCEALGVSPKTVEQWTEIPAIAVRSEHQPESARGSEVFASALPELFDPTRLRFIVGSAAGSSVGEVLLEALGREAPGGSLVTSTRLDAKRLRSWLGARQRDRKPVSLVSDPEGFDRLVDVLERRAVKFRLPPGSEAFCILSFEAASSPRADSWRNPLLPSLGLAPDACRRLLAGPGSATPLLQSAGGSYSKFTLPHWVRAAPIDGGCLAIFDLAAFDTAPRRVGAVPGINFV